MSVTWAGMRVGGLGGIVLWGKVGWYAGMGRGGWTPNLHGTCWQEGRAIYVALSPGVQIMADKGEVWQRLVDKHGLQVGSLCPRTAWDSVGGHERAWPGLGQHGTAWAGMGDSMRGHGAALDSMGQHERAWGSMRQHGTVWDSMGGHGDSMGGHGAACGRQASDRFYSSVGAGHAVRQAGHLAVHGLRL